MSLDPHHAMWSLSLYLVLPPPAADFPSHSDLYREGGRQPTLPEGCMLIQ